MKKVAGRSATLGAADAVRAEGNAEHTQASTRARVARSILENGPSTAIDLATRLDLTAAAVRRHLDVLLADGVVEAREQRVYGPRGRGRPAKVFALTDDGRDAFYQSYDDLAVGALRYLAETAGEEAVRSFARSRLAELERRYRPRIQSASPSERARVLAEALSADGYAATVSTAPATGGAQLCQHHCPVAHVAEQFPELCMAETETFARLLGTHVQRLATIAHGDGVCTTYLPSQSRSTQPSPGARTSRQGARTAPTAPTAPTDKNPITAPRRGAAPPRGSRRIAP